MSRYAMEWAKQLHGQDPEVRLVMIVLADWAQGGDHILRLYGDALEQSTGLSSGKAEKAVGRAVRAGLLQLTEVSAREGRSVDDRKVRDYRLVIPGAFRTQMASRPKGTNVVPVDTPTAVYRLYNAAGQMVYVGVSDRPEVRFAQHEASQPWWGEVVTRELTWYANRRSALAEEERAINQEDPTYNDDSPGRSRRQSARPKVARYVVANGGFERFGAFCDAITADISARKYDQDLMPDVDDLAERYATDRKTALRGLRYLASIDLVRLVDGERYRRLRTWEVLDG